jgi:hypothetical protein
MPQAVVAIRRKIIVMVEIRVIVASTSPTSLIMEYAHSLALAWDARLLAVHVS